MFWNSEYCVSKILSHDSLIIEYVFHFSSDISDRIFGKHEWDGSCVRPWYLWDVTLVCRDGNYKDWHKYLGTFGSGWAAFCTGGCSVHCSGRAVSHFPLSFYDSHKVFNCLSDTWFQAPDHIKLPLPLAYHGMEVINIFTIGGYSDKALEGLGPG